MPYAVKNDGGFKDAKECQKEEVCSGHVYLLLGFRNYFDMDNQEVSAQSSPSLVYILTVLIARSLKYLLI